MKIPLINLEKENRSLRGPVLKAITRVIKSNEFIMKDCGARLESEIARKTGTAFAVGLASGSDALYLALLALGIGSGDEVITTPFTFFATAGSISRTGARPVFADIDPDTYNLDPARARERLTGRTKAVIPVHLFGLCCDMDEIQKIAKKRALAVVEDAAQAFGAFYKGRRAGAMGDAGCFSFYPTKNLGAMGDAGMLVTSSDALAEKVRLLRDHGSKKKYIHERVGVNSRLDEMQAAVLLEKLKWIDRWNAARRRHAADYSAAFKSLPVKIPVPAKQHTFHLYSISTPKRDALKEFLAKNGIGSGVYYPVPLHLQPCYRALGYRKGDFPVSERASREILSLPMYPALTEREKEYVISKVREFFAGRRL